MCSRKQLDEIIQSIKKGSKIEEVQIHQLCTKAKEILREQPNTVNINLPVSVCGDIHGQLDDLLELFKIGGQPPYTNYIFMGDYVDRGKDSVETILLLLAMKVRYKNRVTLLRGNHESRIVTQVYGFYDECIRKYGSLNVWRACTEVFDCMTLSVVVDNKMFCVHGGLSPNIKNINQINSIDRFHQIPQQGAMCDILWSDPDTHEGWASSNRGAGYLFGPDTVQQFCKTNKIILVVRAHQLVMEGYKYMFNQKLVTVWSAPNYYYRCNNLASIMEIDQNMQRSFKIFQAAPNDSRSSDTQQVPHYFL